VGIGCDEEGRDEVTQKFAAAHLGALVMLAELWVIDTVEGKVHGSAGELDDAGLVDCPERNQGGLGDDEDQDEAR
jgi:hypothetical protein